MTVGGATASRFALLGGLYFAQGVPFGFLTVALAIRLSGEGVGPAALGSLIAITQLPWTAKPLFGPLVDLVARRPLLLAAEAMMAASLLVLSTVGAASAAFLPLVFAVSLFAALQDVATDALAIGLLPEGERGRANGMMSAGKYAGVLLGGPGLAWVGSSAGWTTAYVVAAAVLLAPAALVVATAEPPRPATRPRLLGETLRSFAAPAVALAGLFALLAGASDSFLSPTILPLMRQRLGIPEEIVRGLVTLAAVTTVAGALLGGAVADRLGRRRALALAAVLLALAHGAFAALAPLWPRTGVLVAYVIAGGVAGGMLYAALLALFMDLTNPRVAATHFQIYMALLNVRGTWAPLAGGRLAELAPAPAMFAIAAVLELLPLALLPLLGPPRDRGR